MSIHRVVLTSIALLLVGIASSARAADDAELIRDAQATLASFKRTDPGIDKFVQRSAGYAVFPRVGKGGLGVGGAHGTGVLFAHGGNPLGKVTITQVSIGAQVGGQSYSEVVFLETPRELAHFQSGQFSLAAQASAVALKSGASANAKFENGIAVFTASKAGLMYEASVGGQKFGFEPFGKK